MFTIIAAAVAVVHVHVVVVIVVVVFNNSKLVLLFVSQCGHL